MEIHVARNETDQAVQLIQAFANRPDAGLQVLEKMAGVAEKAKQLPLAEQLYTRLANRMGTRGKILLAAFRGRHDRVKEGLDICEPFWLNTGEVALVSAACIEILFGPDGNTRPSDPAQIDRVVGWFEQAIARAKSQTTTCSPVAHRLGERARAARPNFRCNGSVSPRCPRRSS